LILELNSNADTGLSSDSIEKRQQKYGKNQFKEQERDSIFKMVLHHMQNIAAVILCIAAALSL